MNHVRRIVVACGALVLLSAITVPCAVDLTRAPEVTLADLKGARVKVEYRSGKLTLINFWAVWCGPCREEMPQIARLVDKYGGQGFKAVGIAVQSGETGDVKAFLDENKDYRINYPILMGDDDTLARFGDVQAVPTTFLVDSTGRVVRTYIGVTPSFSVKLEDEIKKALAPPPDTKKP